MRLRPRRPAVIAGRRTPAGVIIDFHHVDRMDKQSVHHLVKNYRFAAAMEEIKKCIPLCSNCHRILHWEERETHKREKKRKKALKGAKKA
jgi:predicted HNH restriction endonuclease